MKKMLALVKQQPVFWIAAFCALLSCFFVRPDGEYLHYIDIKVMVLLFCLMTVISGYQRAGLFDLLSAALFRRVHSIRGLYLILVLLPFFTSMLITNDVALLTFVPLTILMVGRNGGLLLYTIVMQTIAANLGSMMTPVGNPQNLYLFSYFSISMSEFFALVFPFAMVAFIFFALSAYGVRQDAGTLISYMQKEDSLQQAWGQTRQHLLLLTGLFLLCMLTVFHIFPYLLLFVICVGVLFVWNRALLKEADYWLLATFAAFFIFSGNLGRLEGISEVLVSLMAERTMLVSIAVSQFISNVPAAVLLSGFTTDYTGLILGTNIGGLGTLVASLASLISFGFYCKCEGARPLKYLGVFCAYNMGFMAILLIVANYL